jgi:hypothetical protein
MCMQYTRVMSLHTLKSVFCHTDNDRVKEIHGLRLTSTWHGAFLKMQQVTQTTHTRKRGSGRDGGWGVGNEVEREREREREPQSARYHPGRGIGRKKLRVCAPLLLPRQTSRFPAMCVVGLSFHAIHTPHTTYHTHTQTHTHTPPRRRDNGGPQSQYYELQHPCTRRCVWVRTQELPSNLTTSSAPPTRFRV